MNPMYPRQMTANEKATAKAINHLASQYERTLGLSREDATIRALSEVQAASRGNTRPRTLKQLEFEHGRRLSDRATELRRQGMRDDLAWDQASNEIGPPRLFPIGSGPTGERNMRAAVAPATICAPLQLSSAHAGGANKTVWIQIAKTGSFKGHHTGPFSMTANTFDEIVRNFYATSNRRVHCDFEHASEAHGAEGSIPSQGAPAAGWITELKHSNGALWGLVDWLEPAKSYIKEGRYRYLSPAVRFNSKDRVTGANIGARLSSVALTNAPFLDNLDPVAARHSA